MAIAARICPNDVRLTLEQAIPGGMSLEDYSLMREVIAAITEGLPEADQLQPGAVFQYVLEPLQDCSNNCPSTKVVIDVLVVTAPAARRWISLLMLFC